jgi:hypothetical protein
MLSLIGRKVRLIKIDEFTADEFCLREDDYRDLLRHQGEVGKIESLACKCVDDELVLENNYWDISFSDGYNFHAISGYTLEFVDDEVNFKEFEDNFSKLPKEEQNKLLLNAVMRSPYSLQFVDEAIKKLSYEEKKDLLLKAIDPKVFKAERAKQSLANNQ